MGLQTPDSYENLYESFDELAAKLERPCGRRAYKGIPQWIFCISRRRETMMVFRNFEPVPSSGGRITALIAGGSPPHISCSE